MNQKIKIFISDPASRFAAFFFRTGYSEFSPITESENPDIVLTLSETGDRILIHAIGSTQAPVTLQVPCGYHKLIILIKKLHYEAETAPKREIAIPGGVFYPGENKIEFSEENFAPVSLTNGENRLFLLISEAREGLPLSKAENEMNIHGEKSLQSALYRLRKKLELSGPVILCEQERYRLQKKE